MDLGADCRLYNGRGSLSCWADAKEIFRSRDSMIAGICTVNMIQSVHLKTVNKPLHNLLDFVLG